MRVKEILQEKKRQICCVGNPCLIEFTAEEINILSDLDELRCLKLQESMPRGYEPERDPFTCFRRILEGDSIYRVLEFCLLKNRALRNSVPKVFSVWS